MTTASLRRSNTIMSSGERPDSLGDVIERVIAAGDRETVTLRAVIEATSSSSFAAILLLPAVAVATPLSGIPFFSSLMGILICLIAVQMLIRRDHLWLPQWILRRSMKGPRVTAAFAKLRPAAAWLDKRTDRRFRLMNHRPLIYVPQILCVISGAIMPILEFVPFSSSILGVGVSLLALGMLTRDGVVIIVGLIPYGIVAFLIQSAIA